MFSHTMQIEIGLWKIYSPILALKHMTYKQFGWCVFFFLFFPLGFQSAI